MQDKVCSPGHEIEMEARRCVKCNAPFRVMKTSPLQTCSTQCAVFNKPGPGAGKVAAGPKVEKIKINVQFKKPKDPAAAHQAEVRHWLTTPKHERELLNAVTHQKPMREERRMPGNISAGECKIQKPGKPSSSTEESSMPKTENVNAPPNAATTTKTERNAMPNERNGLRETKTDSSPTKEKTTPKTEKNAAPKLMHIATPGSLIASSAARSESLNKAALDSMFLLQESGNKLLRLIDEAVSHEDLDKSKEGVQRVETHRIHSALEAARALAQTVQVQVNMVKALGNIGELK